MNFCDCDDELPSHQHRAGEIWIPVDWKAVARELVITGERPDYLMKVIHVLAEAMLDNPPHAKNSKISASMKRHWEERKSAQS